MAIVSIDSHIEPLLVLENIEAGSIKVWLRNILRVTDDDALKKLDWKPQVGKYLVRAKYAALRWLDAPEPLSIPNLAEELKKIAQETDVRYLPDYAPVNEAKLVEVLEKVQDAKRQLVAKDKLTITTEHDVYEIDISKQSSIPTLTSGDDLLDADSHAEMILIVRKPDMIGKSKWQFRVGHGEFSASIKDDRWLERYHHGEIAVFPGDALRCWVRFVNSYKAGGLTGQRVEIEEVRQVIPGPGGQRRIAGI